MTLRRLVSIVAALAMTPALAQSPAPNLTPRGPWTVHYDEDLCLMERRYPVEGGEVMMAFQPLLDMPTVEISIVAPDRNDRQFVGNFNATVEPGARQFHGSYFSAISNTNRGTRVTRLTIDRAALDGLKTGDVLHVDARPVDLRFAIAGPERAMVALKECVADLKRSWGIDGPEPPTPAVPAIDLSEYFTPSSYPSEAMGMRISGRVIMLLNIAATGRVERCRVVSSAGAVLNAGTCRIGMTIRFRPAKDAAGQPVPSSYIMPVRWVYET